MCNSAIGFDLLNRPIDLFYDIRHLCTRFRVDGIKATSRAFSGDKQKFAGTSNGGRVSLFFQNETTILVMQNVQIRFVKFYVIIARCEDMYGRYCIKRHTDHFHALSSLILKKTVVQNESCKGRKITLLTSYLLSENHESSWFQYIFPSGVKNSF